MLAGKAFDQPERDLLLRRRGAFLLGNLAPDVQVVSGQTRLDTHFFDLPVQRNRLPAWTNLFSAHPGLTHPRALPEDQAAFLAGYLCHLMADWLWALEIFNPVFAANKEWENFPRRLYLHNVLRAYLDRDILPGLPQRISSDLLGVTPHGWLPFVEDHDLLLWRDDLAGQLSGERIRTVEVFAERQGLPPQEYYQLLDSDERMHQEVFAHLPRRALDGYRQRAESESARLVRAYLSHALDDNRLVDWLPSGYAEG